MRSKSKTKTIDPSTMDSDESNEVLQLDTILGTIASAVLKSDFESNKPVLRKTVDLQVFPDPTMGNNVAEMIDEKKLFLNPVQFRLLGDINWYVLQHRSKGATCFHMKQGLGLCVFEHGSFLKDDMQQRGWSLTITNVSFDNCCYFGENYCGNRKRERVWGKDQYCEASDCFNCKGPNACSCCPTKACVDCRDE